MIIQTTKVINGAIYDYAYSDSGYMIERDGVRYSEAVDPLNSGRVYTETDELIEIKIDNTTVEDYWKALNEFIAEVWYNESGVEDTNINSITPHIESIQISIQINSSSRFETNGGVLPCTLTFTIFRHKKL